MTLHNTVITKFVSNFDPAVNGFQFSNNNWPSNPIYIQLLVPIPGNGIPIADASKGLCGGMVFAARDYFQIHQPLSSVSLPANNTPLYNYIFQRLIDSFGLSTDHFTSGHTALRFWTLMNPALPDHETTIEPLGHGRAWLMIKEEWPKIKADIDMQILSPIGLVLVKSLNPFDMQHHHQVLVYGYSLNGNNLTLFVYDPNSPQVQCKISLNISNPAHTTNVSYSGQLKTNEKIWCFFRIDDYFPRDPRSFIPTPQPPQPPRPIPTACQSIANNLKELQGELKDAQQELASAVGSEKAVLATAIKNLNTKITQQQKLLDKCIQQHPT